MLALVTQVNQSSKSVSVQCLPQSFVIFHLLSNSDLTSTPYKCTQSRPSFHFVFSSLQLVKLQNSKTSLGCCLTLLSRRVWFTCVTRRSHSLVTLEAFNSLQVFWVVHPYYFSLEGGEFSSNFKATSCWFAILAYDLDTFWRTFVEFQNTTNCRLKTAALQYAME